MNGLARLLAGPTPIRVAVADVVSVDGSTLTLTIGGDSFSNAPYLAHVKPAAGMTVVALVTGTQYLVIGLTEPPASDRTVRGKTAFTASASAQEQVVSFGSTFPTPPTVVASLDITSGHNRFSCLTVGITTTAFTCRIIQNENITPGVAASGNINWIAIGPG